MNTSRIEEFEAFHRSRLVDSNPRPRARIRRKPPQYQQPPRIVVNSVTHSEISDTIISNPPNFFRELGTLVSAAIKTRTAKLQHKIGTFGKDLLGSSHRIRKRQAKTSSENRRIQQIGNEKELTSAPDDGGDSQELFNIPPVAPVQVVPDNDTEGLIEIPPVQPPAQAQTSRVGNSMSIAQQGSVKVVGMDKKADKWMRNFVLLFFFLYSLVFLFLILFRVLVPTLNLVGILFTGFFITLLAAICSAVAWNYMQGVLGKVFLAATLAIEIGFATLLSTQLRWWTVLACTITLIFIVTSGMIFVFLSDVRTRKGSEMFNLGGAVALIFCLYGALYFIGVGGMGYIAWVMLIATITALFVLFNLIATFYWEVDTRYEGFDHVTAGFFAFAVLSFAAFVVLCLLMGIFISLRTQGLSIGFPLFNTDTDLFDWTLPGSVFANLF